MTEAILTVLGGLGLFLTGMAIMTTGLKGLVGDAFHHALTRFTKSPLTGAMTGAIGTAILQSSSATCVMAVGFAGAGLLSFPQALGIVFGANVGTTVTGWLVALLGFKLNLSQVVMPVIFVGALMRLLGTRTVASVGYALAGFGLIFVGISTLQVALQGFGGNLTPESFPPNTWTGRFLLLLLGALITLVTQSSSAGVATAITAVHVGTISLPQAAAMVIGMDVGTTFTAALATVGGTTNARRTGLAHVIYNLFTGVGAFFALPGFVAVWENYGAEFLGSADPEIALVAFHSLFNLLGVIIILPFTQQFARLITAWIRPSGSELTQRLDKSLLSQPGVALAAVTATHQALTLQLLAILENMLQTPQVELDPELEEAINETQVYLAQIDTSQLSPANLAEYTASLHVLDHLARLVLRCKANSDLKQLYVHRDLKRESLNLADTIAACRENQFEILALSESLERAWQRIDKQVAAFRENSIQATIDGNSDALQTLSETDAMRWLRRVAYHAWRIAWHAAHALRTDPPASPPYMPPEELSQVSDIPE